MRVVLDTNVLISALGWEGPEHILLLEILEGRIDLSISPGILEEFVTVASRRKFGFTESEIDELVTAILEIGDMVIPEERIDAIKEDPKDNMVLECALSSGSDLIVTGDRHLLSLVEYRGTRIVGASAFIKEMTLRSSMAKTRDDGVIR